MIISLDSTSSNGLTTGTLSPNSGTDLAALAKLSNNDSTYLIPDSDGTPCSGTSLAYHLDITGQGHTTLDVILRWLHHLVTGNGGGSQTVEQTVSINFLNGAPNSGTVFPGIPAWFLQIFATYSDTIIYDSNDPAPSESFIDYPYSLNPSEISSIVDWEDIWIIIDTSAIGSGWCDGAGDESTAYISRLSVEVDAGAGVTLEATLDDWRTVSISWDAECVASILQRQINGGEWISIATDESSPYTDNLESVSDGDVINYRLVCDEELSNEDSVTIDIVSRTLSSVTEPVLNPHTFQRGVP